MMLQKSDNEVYTIIQHELERQRHVLEMIPSENFTSVAVMEALGTVLTNKYSEGYAGRRYYGGNQFIDDVETLAIERAKKLFSVEHANVQPYSGSPANQAVYFALLNPGDTVLGMELAMGGHLTHGYKLNFSGKYFKAVSYGVDKTTHRIDYDDVREIARREKPKMIIAGATAYPREFDFKKFAEIASEVNAYFLADISHVTGLIIAGVHQSPFEHADVVMTTTHKTLRGPRGAMLLVPKKADRLHDIYHPASKKDLAQLIDSAIIPGLQGGPHNHQTAAIAVAMKEAMEPSFKEYGRQVVKNAKVLADSLISGGLELITGGTDNHLILADVTKYGVSGKQAEELLDSVGITVNKNLIPFDTRKPLDPSGIRLGTPALTTRGFNEDEMKRIGGLITDILKNPDNSSAHETVRKEVRAMTDAHSLYPEL
ncbi:MAG: serine hydroxymethyltransferase [Candidatus Kerfeldbacteria bacterium RIFCSPLOWO2_01_FULL_48_11]|uniref:Serine hydroxymethyltransferase n=1 Tax=Candidatus Kerfeldbacteria bacterium RIFCSPLOWO2_01_FULL_48_11 TaxID=1798543 RepID=A0A1G2B460_9BACT|nr:MAG: Serine hydroxymethyltransferase [Parcubacteria group bacterium GW2011_GWC2_49_9]OGY83954.1 MAG: serine hydroxymethyltransferase [Candidatus Kerfeldbacteria bacterium RIFCSPLOWO2_01_FULL_48_11]HCJ52759.1 serine hydroxymethyltransferase [Candidatus Kerfeldbacteria bacterium]